LSDRPAKPLVFELPVPEGPVLLPASAIPDPIAPLLDVDAPPAPRPVRTLEPDGTSAERGVVNTDGTRGGREFGPKREPAPLLIDVTPLSLLVETAGGFGDVLIEANTPVPCRRTRSFATASHEQTVVRVRVAQGGSKRFEENTFLGELELADLPRAPRGETKIAVTFDIDSDGILSVRACDTKSGRETLARLRLVGGDNALSEIEAMRARQAGHRPGETEGL
jgi:molecular chaperone DnaK